MRVIALYLLVTPIALAIVVWAITEPFTWFRKKEIHMPNDTQRAIKLIGTSIDSEVLNGYLRKDLPTPDIALLLEARQNTDVYDHLTVAEQTLLNLMLDLQEGSSRVTVTDLTRYVTDEAQLVAALRAIARQRGIKLVVEEEKTK